MKARKFFKIGVILSLLFFLSQNLSAKDYVLNHDDLIDPRALQKINEIGNEVKEKLGVNIYIYAKESLGLDENLTTQKKLKLIKDFENQILPVLTKPYVLLTMSVEDTHVNLIYSKNLENILDKDDILDGYVVPLLASKDKNSLLAKVSASMLNGYAAIADTIADEKNIELESSIGSQGKVSSTIWRVLMYFMIVTGLLAYTYAVLKKKN